MTRRPRRPFVLARDQHGEEHRLEVLTQYGLIVLRDDAMIRLLPRQAAVELGLWLIRTSAPAVRAGATQ